MKIAIVCNGIKSIHNKNGSFIDSCDKVIRMNRFRIEGFEEWVGSKIDIISLMLTGDGVTSGLLGYDPLLNYVSRASAIWIPDKYREEHIANRSRASDHFRIKENSFVFVSTDDYDFLMKRIEAVSLMLGYPQQYYYPDSGMTIIETCINMYPDAEIYVAGFDPHRTYEYKYYWERDLPTTEALNCHPQKAESFIYDQYIAEKKIKEI